MALRRAMAEYHRRTLDPDERGPGLSLCRAVLGLLSLAYGAGVRLRNAAYDRGIRKVHHAAVPVISVGNLTAGGAGKTPFAAWLAGFLRGRGLRPAILSRGYGADPRSGLDDENQMLRLLAAGTPVVVDPDRARGASRALAEHSSDVLILDDGFQHRRLARELDVVLVDALRPFGGGRLLPRGLLREPPGGLRRAHCLVVTRSDQVCRTRLEEIRRQLARHAGDVPIGLAFHRPTGLRALCGPAGEREQLAPGDLSEGTWAAFCGLGNPDAFRLTLEGLGARLAGFAALPDHHRYRSDEVATLLAAARRAGCRGALTTEKDAIKVERLLGAATPVPVFALGVRMEVTEGRETLERRILSAVGVPGT